MAKDRLNPIHSDQGRFRAYFCIFLVVMNLFFLFGSRADLPLVMLPAFLALVAGSVVYYRKMLQIEKDAPVKTAKFELFAFAFLLGAIGLALGISWLLFVLV